MPASLEEDLPEMCAETVQPILDELMDFETRDHGIEAAHRVIATGYCCRHPEVVRDVVKMIDLFVYFKLGTIF